MFFQLFLGGRTLNKMPSALGVSLESHQSAAGKRAKDVVHMKITMQQTG
jgi:hypothetical protein